MGGGARNKNDAATTALDHVGRDRLRQREVADEIDFESETPVEPEEIIARSCHLMSAPIEVLPAQPEPYLPGQSGCSCDLTRHNRRASAQTASLRTAAA
jgi:hypothetical protein